MGWEEFRGHCHTLANKIKTFDADKIIGVSRGGLVPAVLIAKELKLPLAVYDPSSSYNDCFINHRLRYAVIDDLVALGRTYDRIIRNSTGADLMYCSILVDAAYEGSNDITTSLVTSDWIVFPWEEEDKVVEGDHGLFRDRTDRYKE